MLCMLVGSGVFKLLSYLVVGNVPLCSWQLCESVSDALEYINTLYTELKGITQLKGGALFSSLHSHVCEYLHELIYDIFFIQSLPI